MLELETKIKIDTKKSTSEITKLNAKLNKQDTLVNKYFGVENEMVSLRQKVMNKDSEIGRLNKLLTKAGNAIEEEDEDADESDDEK